ncbi:hypothetical protein GCM10027422_48690 [Hymenobacter arcticus]
MSPLTSTPATRTTEGSITVQASGGTGNLRATLSAVGYSFPFTLSPNTPATITNLPRIVQDTSFTVRVVDRDGSFAAASNSIVVQAWTGCRITLATAYESTAGATITAPFSELATNYTQLQLYAQTRRQGTADWLPAQGELVTPYAGSGGQYITTTTALYNATYDLRVYYDLASNGGRCTAEWQAVSIRNGAPLPNPCELTVAGVGQAPTRAGVNDGKVTVTITHAQGTDVALRLLQDGQPIYQQTAPFPVTYPATLPNASFTFEMTGILPGDYDLDGRISSSCLRPADATVTVDPPELQIGDQLTFVPWVQPTLAHAADGLRDNRPTVSLSAKLRTDHGAEDLIEVAAAEIYGPGDVLGIAQRAILTTSPAPGAVGFSPLQLAFIDFKEEDLPWRYSTRKIVSSPTPDPALPNTPLPWLLLLVLQAGEFERQGQTGQPLPSINILAAAAAAYPSPDPEQQKLWAHVQVNKSLGTALTAQNALGQPTMGQPTATEVATFFTQDLPNSPDLAYSRVVCPRRLAPETAYYAFLVPAVEAGRLAGLGLEFGNNDVVASSLPLAGSVAADRAFPVYFQWKFSTGSEDDFETLVQQLHQANATTSAALSPSLAFATAAGTYQLPLASALVDAATPVSVPDPHDQTAQQVAGYLYGQVAPGRSASGRPLMGAPLYGRSYFVTPGLDPTLVGVADSWKYTLNLDPRYRSLAAVGTEVVRDNQEEYVRRAWEQAQDILLANEKLRGAQYGLRATAGLRDQHLPVNTTVTTTTATAGSGQRLASNFAATTSDDAHNSATNDEATSSARPAPAARFASAGATAATTPQEQRTTALADYGLQLTAPSMRRVRVSATTRAAATEATAQSLPTGAIAPGLPAHATLYEAVRRSTLPLAAFSPAFRRISKPLGNFQVNQAGRPLRPTQAETEPDPNDLRTPGTSLRQRDAVLSQLSAGTLTAAPPHAEALRGYQFADDVVDAYLKGSVPQPGQAATVSISSPSLTGSAAQRFGLAYRGFVTQAVSLATNDVTVVGFRKPQHVRLSLPLDPLKADVVAGTAPGPVFQVKIKTVAPTLGSLPTLPTAGDYLGTDFNATDFFVGDFDEPAHLVAGDWLPADFAAADFLVPRTVWDYETPPPVETPPIVVRPTQDDYALTDNAGAASSASADEAGSNSRTFGQAAYTSGGTVTTTTTTTTTTTASTPATDAGLPIIKQAKVFPSFKEAMGEALRLRHPELFVPGLADFPTGGLAVLDVNQAFIEAYMVGLNHALGSELSWRGFPVDLRGTFFQQFWDVSEHFNATLAAGTLPTAAQEAVLLDIKPLDQWISNQLGTNAVTQPLPGTETLRLALRSELVRRYPNLILALQDDSLTPAQAPTDYTDPANFRHPLQRLAVGQDLVVVAFDVSLQHAYDHCALVLMERPGQPKFGLDAEEPGLDYTLDPVGWNDLTWAYAGTRVNQNFTPTTTGALGSKPHAAAEPTSVAYLTDSSTLAYALFQEPVLATIPISNILSV